MSVFNDNAYNPFILIYSTNNTKRAVYPSFIFVVFNEYNLRAGLYLKLKWSREGGLREVTCYCAVKNRRVAL